MTAGKRIALNVAATYGRSLVALVCGLFAGRWLLMSLGTTDYGLYGVIGGLAAFVTFFNSLLAISVERFFAFAVGEAEKLGTRVECRRWFSVAVGLHFALAVVLVAAGYPVGVWAIERFLNIPVDRVTDCVWIFRFVCLNCLVGMATVPMYAMYTAKQNIAELTVYGAAQTVANVAVLGYAVTHPGDWLVRYAGLFCAIQTVPSLLIAVTAFLKFPECRFRIAYVLDRARIVKVVDFMGCRLVNMLAQMLSAEGLSVVVNKYLGATRNASMTVANSVQMHVMTLSGSIAGAFMPAITNAAGAGEFGKMRDYAYRTCLLSTLMVLVVAVPLSLEIDAALRLWLVNPPPFAAGLCLCVLATAVVERLSDGHWMSIFAVGTIRQFQIVESFAFFGAFALGWALMGGGFDVLSAGVGVLIGRSANVLVKLHYGRVVAGLSVRIWLRRAFLPVALLTVVSLAVGAVPRLLMAESVLRIVLTGLSSLATLGLLAWLIALSAEERAFVRRQLGGME